MALLISGVFDLSVGSIFALGSVFCGYLIKSVGLPYPIAMILALCGCAFLGAVNAFIITKMHVNALITTLATMGIFKGLAIIIGGAGIMGLPKEFIYFGRTDFLGIPSPSWYFLIILAVFSYLFSNVAYFRKYYFVGGNEKAATLSGISVNHIRFTGYILSGLLAGFDGSSGGGICPAVREAGRAGDIKVVMNDILPAHMECLKEGTAQYIVGQKRHIFGPIALQTLYDINHSGISFTNRDDELEIFPAPDKIDTGFLVVTQDNFEDMDQMVKNLEKL